MPGSYPERRRSRSPFLVTPYVAGPDGKLVPQIPTKCPHALLGHEGHQGADCKLSIQHRRSRKTGSVPLLAVARCAMHDDQAAFTLYPPGLAPYLRQPVQQLSPDGQEPVAEPPQDAQLVEQWRGTVFEAAVDASSGRAWPRSTDAAAPVDGSWGTQCRQLQAAARLVGVACDLTDKAREAISATLGVGMLVLRELTAAARGYRAVGRAVCDVLQRLRGGARRAMQLLVCGHLVGRWGEPRCWDPGRRVLECSPFSSSGTTLAD